MRAEEQQANTDEILVPEEIHRYLFLFSNDLLMA